MNSAEGGIAFLSVGKRG